MVKKNGTYVWEPDKFSKCEKFEFTNFKNDTMNAKNVEVTNYVIVCIFKNK